MPELPAVDPQAASPVEAVVFDIGGVPADCKPWPSAEVAVLVGKRA